MIITVENSCFTIIISAPKLTFITGQLDPVERVPFVNETVHSLFRRHEVPLTEGGGQPTPLHSTS